MSLRECFLYSFIKNISGTSVSATITVTSAATVRLKNLSTICFSAVTLNDSNSV